MASGFVFLSAEFHGSFVVKEINEAACVVTKQDTSCLFVVNQGNASGKFLVERNGNEVCSS